MDLALASLVLFGPVALAQRAPVTPLVETPGVLFHGKLSNDTKGFEDTLDPNDSFGAAVAALGDLDGNGFDDLALGAPGDSDGGIGGGGAVYLLLRGSGGEVQARRKISATRGAFPGLLRPSAGFGTALAALGDLDGDGVVDLAVGASTTRDGLTLDIGAAWLLFLRPNGRVKRAVKIDRSTPGLVAGAPFLAFGSALASPGDWNGDGVPDLVIGESSNLGRIWLLFLRRDGSLAGSVETLLPVASATTSLAFVDDLDGDGRRELARCASGSVSILFLAADGSVRATRSILNASAALVGAGDHDADGRGDLIAAPFGSNSIEFLHLDPDGSVAARETSSTQAFTSVPSFPSSRSVALLADRAPGGALRLALGLPLQDYDTLFIHGTTFLFDVVPGRAPGGLRREGHADGKMAGTLDPNGGMGSAVTTIGDVDGDGRGDVAFGVPNDDHRGLRSGAVWIAFLAADGTVKSHRKIAAGESGFAGVLHTFDRFGSSLAAPGDIDADGTPDLIVGAPGDDDGGPIDFGSGLGAIWVLLLRPDGTVKKHVKISAIRGGFHGILRAEDSFGASLATAGDLDGNGVCDLFVGAPNDDEGGFNRGSVWLLHLRRDGSCRAQQKITLPATSGLQDRTFFGQALAALGDLDHDGVGDLAVGAPSTLDGAFLAGAVWVVFLGRDGSVRAQQKISATSGGFLFTPLGGERFGQSLAAPGDLDGDGVLDLLVGMPAGGAIVPGTVWCLSLDGSGQVARQLAITGGSAGFQGDLDGNDGFGSSLALLGDATADGVVDIAVGATGDDDYRNEHGAVWLLALDGLATLDFERGQHALTTVDGQALSGAVGLGTGVHLTSGGANLGAALFDSSRGGPNDPSQDPDLLVGRGNVLMLQDSLHATQTSAGRFDTPNDDADGGRLRFEFERPVAPSSIDLVDVDAGARSFVRLRLEDEGGGVRSFDVPAEWTGDRVADGTSGVATLNLTTLAPQPGFGSTATEVESPGFRPDRVVVIEVELGSSGAIDGLRFDPRP